MAARVNPRAHARAYAILIALAVCVSSRDAAGFYGRESVSTMLALAGPAAVDTTNGDAWWKVPISSRARLDLRLTADEATAPWTWDAQSRSPLDLSRFMIDATVGDARTGTLYAKGAASWQDTDDAAGHVDFLIEQGEYAFGRGDITARAFGDERRFFTGDLGTASMDDDVVEQFEHRIGIRADGEHGVWGGTALVSRLEEDIAARTLTYAKAQLAASHVAAALSYQVQEGGDDASDHAVAKGEVAAYWKRASAVASYEQSGVGSGVFLPEGTWGSLGDGYRDAAPENSATFLEMRLARGAIGNSALLAAVYRYGYVGTAYTNDLTNLPAGSERHHLGAYLSHRHQALDGRVVYFDDHLIAYRAHGVTASARAFLKDQSEMFVRGAFAERTRDDGGERTTGVAHAAYRRSLQEFMGGIHALVDEIGDNAVTRIGLETRVNWNATSALYLRWMVAGATARTDAVYARLEFRPTGRTWVTLAYGRATAGDGPYFLEDDDALPTVDTEDVLTVTVRGDF
jgi:hypothetical protein